MKIAVRALIVHQNKILLVRHKHRNFYSLPGGKIDPDEDIKTALRREMVEELGVKTRDEKMRLVHEFRYPDAGEFSVEFFFTVGNPEDFLQWKKSTHTEAELAEVLWLPIESDFDIKPNFLREKLPDLFHTNGIEYISAS